ncbi:MAG: GNAT family N-acetyltransferase [Candidatus Hodarchaeales archaeon]
MTEFAKETTSPILETKRLIIKQLTSNDVEFIFNHFSQEEINRFVYIRMESLEDAQEFYERWCVRNDFTRFRLGIALKDSPNRSIGTMFYKKWNKKHNTAEIGYDLSKNYWGQGLMTEALEALIQYGFEEMKLNRIEAFTNSENVMSERLLERFSFVKEGILRKKIFHKGKYQDELIYSLIIDDWKEDKVNSKL